MIRRTDHGYQFRVGDEWRTLKDPHGPASPAQLARLNREGILRIALPGSPSSPISKLDAAHAIDDEAAA